MVRKPARTPQRRPIPQRPRPAKATPRAYGTALLIGFLVVFGVTIGLIARMGDRPALKSTEMTHASIEPKAVAKTEPPSQVEPEPTETDIVEAEDDAWVEEMREAAERKRLAAE